MQEEHFVNDLFSERIKNGGVKYGKLELKSELIDFSLGMPAPASLPLQEMTEAAMRALQRHGQWPLQYGSPYGFAGLLDLLQEKICKERGILCQREQLLLTSGSSQAIGLLCELMLDPNDVILCEMPTYSWALRIFAHFGAHIEAIPLDGDGLQVDVLEEKLHCLKRQHITPKFLYTIPNFQNPTGLVTTLQRREQLVEIAQRYRLSILEDDAYFGLRFTGEALPTLYELAHGHNVFYLGTLSKIIAPGLRLGWTVAPADIIYHLASFKVDACTNPFGAHVAYEFCTSEQFDQRLQLLPTLYQQRCDVILSALNASMPRDVSWTIPSGGFYTWLTLPDVDTEQMLPLAHDAGISYLPGSACFDKAYGQQHLRLSYSYVSEELTIAGVSILAQLINKSRKSL